MTIIADDGGPIGVAGVMGGADTEVGTDTTRTCSSSAPTSPLPGVRRSRRALGLSTEASYRFERGIDRWGGAEALRRCVEIIGATAGGELAEAPLDLGPGAGNPSRDLPPTSLACLTCLGGDLPCGTRWRAIWLRSALL